MQLTSRERIQLLYHQTQLLKLNNKAKEEKFKDKQITSEELQQICKINTQIIVELDKTLKKIEEISYDNLVSEL